MLATCSEKAAARSQTVGLKVERAVGRRRFESGEIGLLDLRAADKEDLIFDTGMLEKIAQLKVMDVDASTDDVRNGVDMLDAASHGRRCAKARMSAERTQDVVMGMTLSLKLDCGDKQRMLSRRERERE